LGFARHASMVTDRSYQVPTIRRRCQEIVLGCFGTLA
jgi:hypothetical protein